MTYQRYVDADLAKVGPVVSLESRYGEPTYAWAWRLGGGLLAAVLALGAFVALLRSRPKRVRAARFAMPEVVTPFSVLGLLREIEHKNGLSAPQKGELAASIQQLERHYFAESNGAEPDLEKIAETWISLAT
jgi:hypothetical protein